MNYRDKTYFRGGEYKDKIGRYMLKAKNESLIKHIVIILTNDYF